MQNLTVSSQLVAQKNNAKASNAAANTDQGESGVAADGAPESAADTFGKILAQQVALAKPGKDEALVAALKDRIKGTETQEDDAAGVGTANQVLYLDPNALPMQKFLASNASTNAASKSAFADGVPSEMSAIAGKELPVGNGKTAGIAGLMQSPAASDPSGQDTSAVDESFGLMLAEKQQSSSTLDATAQPDPAISATQLQNVTTPAAKSNVDQTLTVPQKVGAEDWGTGLGDKVVWMVGNQTRGAEIHLNPPALGPLEVRVSITDGQANLSFMTHHAGVREAIEAATPRLREMLGDTGISMGSVSVDVGSFAQQQSQQQQTSSSGNGTNPDAWFSLSNETDGPINTFTTFVQPGRGRGVVDYFA